MRGYNNGAAAFLLGSVPRLVIAPKRGHNISPVTNPHSGLPSSLRGHNEETNPGGYCQLSSPLLRGHNWRLIPVRPIPGSHRPCEGSQTSGADAPLGPVTAPLRRRW